VPRGTQGQRRESGPLSLTGLSPSMVGLSSTFLLEAGFVTPWRPCKAPGRALQPLSGNDCSLDTRQVWAVPLSLATTQGMISFPRGTEMFQFPRFPPARLCVQRGVPGFYPGGFPHSGTSGYNAC
jgi:hypothetical protein